MFSFLGGENVFQIEVYLGRCECDVDNTTDPRLKGIIS